MPLHAGRHEQPLARPDDLLRGGRRGRRDARPDPIADGEPVALALPVKSRKAQLAEARRLGLIVEPVRRTGEIRIKPPDGGPSVRINNRRTDGTRAVMRMLEAYSPDEGVEPPKERPMPTATKPPPASRLTVEQAVKVIAGRTTEDVLREIAAEGKADPRVSALVVRFDARAKRRAAKTEAEDAE